MVEKIWNLFLKYKEAVLYLVFGGLTTLINIVAYALCKHIIGIDTIPANAIAWILSVAFAYVTNKIFVFESKTSGMGALIKECLSFVWCRLATGLMDMAIMYVTVDVLHWSDMVMKILSNILVIVLNFVFSKLFIFAKKTEKA